MDGIDAVVAEFKNSRIDLIANETFPYTAELRDDLHAVIAPAARLSLDEFGSLHVRVGQSFADAANRIISASGLSPTAVTAIGSHGQTVRHSPQSDPPYTLQIGDPATIATRTGIATVADFRSLDVAAGGEGAPLVPPFHSAFLRESHIDSVVVNLGGIANITTLPVDRDIPPNGFDTGPANCLLNDWAMRHLNKRYDKNGSWAAAGAVSQSLLEVMMADDYINAPIPKSTGREHFNIAFIDQALSVCDNQALNADRRSGDTRRIHRRYRRARYSTIGMQGGEGIGVWRWRAQRRSTQSFAEELTRFGGHLDRKRWNQSRLRRSGSVCLVGARTSE